MNRGRAIRKRVMKFENAYACECFTLARYGLRNTLARLTPTVSRARPLARRALMTLRPPGERILRRKPCTRKRCKRFG